MGAEGVCFVTVFPEPVPRQVQFVFWSWRRLLWLLFLLASLRACSWNPVMKPITRLAGKTHACQGGSVHFVALWPYLGLILRGGRTTSG